jgi:ATP-binding cassette subfamily B protein
MALARAYFRDAGLVILDEPAAALDAEAEAALFATLKELCAGRAVVMISHRFSTVTGADRIYVLDEGRIVEQGTHAELLARNGRYATMFKLQASHYLAPVDQQPRERTASK